MTGLSVDFGANISGLTSGIAQANSQLSSFVSGANSRLQSFGDSISNVGQKISIGLSVPLGLLTKQVLENGGGLESLKMGLKSIEEQQYGVGKSAEYATARYNEYVQLAKLPGIGLKEAIGMSIGLRSVGFSADDAKREILAFGNALALVGKGKNELNGVALQLQQLSGKTTGFGADLRVIKEYAPQVGGALMKAFGTIDTEAIAKTGVTGKQVIEKITLELEKLPKAGAGIKNAMENVVDSIFNATGRIGESLSKTLGLTSIFDNIGNSVTGLATAFEGLSPETQKFIGITAGLLVIVPPLLIALGGISTAIASLGGAMLIGATAIKGFVATSIFGMTEFVAAITISFAEASTAVGFFSNMLLLNPIGLAIAGIVLLGGAMYGLSKILGSTTKEVSNLQNAENQLNEVKKANYGTFEIEISKTGALVSIIKSNIRSLEEKQTALNQLIAISPKYFEGLTIEAVRAGQADEAIKKYTKSIFENAVTKGAEAKISKLSEQLVNEKDAYDEATAKAEKYRKEVSGKQISAGMGVFIKKGQFSNQINDEVNDAYANIQKTQTALQKLSEFVAVRTIKADGTLPPTPPKTKALTDEELKAQEKAQAEFYKNTQKLLSDSLKIENSLITQKYARELAQEKQAYEEKVKQANQEKASTASKHKILEALEKEHEANLTKIIREGMQGRTAVKSDGGLEGVGTRNISTALNIPNPLGGLSDKLGQSMGGVSGRFDSFAGQLSPKMQKMKGIFEGLNTGIQSSLQDATASAFSGLGNVFGAMIAGNASIGDAGKAIMGVIGNVFGQMGEMFAKAGVALLLLEPLVTNPFTSGPGMILAGVALSALSGAISSSVSSGGASGSTSASSSYAQNYSSGSSSYGGGSAYGGGGNQNQTFTINLTGKLTADGNDLSHSLDKSIRQKARTYGSR